ncbi:50S ribosomal protein L21 [Patescibacteria group bacterium]|nr:50S ribosomal protein L21 [Patescibacteria group bacterium]MBU4078194.1 50S ribosomal protein L21 [Patescibacteria group bacterium]
MLAVIKTGGKQYLVKPGDKIKVEKIDKEPGKEISFAEILLLEKDNKIELGTPFVKDAKVKAEILEQDKYKKVIIFKYKAKKRYKKKTGHRQPYSLIEIKSIETKSSSTETKSVKAKPVKIKPSAVKAVR